MYVDMRERERERERDLEMQRTMEPSTTVVSSQMSLKAVPLAHSYTTCTYSVTTDYQRLSGIIRKYQELSGLVVTDRERVYVFMYL